MTVEIETKDLNTLIKALNNAIIAYNDYVKNEFLFGLEKMNLPEKWHKLTLEDIEERLSILVKLYIQLDIKEKENDDKRREVSTED